jgi:excisionase family DNA binding protein
VIENANRGNKRSTQLMRGTQMNQPETRRLLKVQEAAEYTSMSKHTLNGLRVKGGGPKFVKLGSSVRYQVSDLDEWIRSNKVAHTTERDSEIDRAKSVLIRAGVMV